MGLSKIRVLVLEDTPSDAELMMRQLKREGFDTDWRRVDTKEEFAANLEPSLDLILADYHLPQFDGLQALRLVQEYNLDIPFILVSGAIIEEQAIEIMRAGADDYLLKDRLARLGTAVRKALADRSERAERRAEQNQLRRMASIIEQSPISIVLTDTDGTIEYVNPQFCRLTEYSKEEVIGQNPNIIQSGNTPDKLYEQLWQTIKAGRNWQGEMQNRKKSGALFWEKSYIAPLHNEQGEITHFVALKEDITERKAIEGELKQREEQLREAQRLAHLGYWEIDIATETVTWSDEIYRIYGPQLKQTHLSVADIVQLFHPEDRERLLASYQYVLKTLEPASGDFRIVRGDGKERVVHARGEVRTDEAGNPVTMVGSVQDVTELHLAEAALRHSEMQYRTLFETMTEGVVYHDAGGDIIGANAAAERILGRSLEEIQGRIQNTQWRMLREDGSEFPEAEFPIARALRTGEKVQNEVMGVYNPQEEEYRWVNVSAVPEFLPGEARPYRLYSTFSDITDRVRRETEMAAVVAVTSALRNAGTREEMLPIIVEQTRQLLNAEAAILVLRDEATGQIRIVHGTGAWEKATGEVLPEWSLNGRIIRTGQAYVSEDMPNEPGLARPDLYGAIPASAGVPLATRNETIGALCGGRRQPFTAIELRLLHLIAEVAASAIQRATLHEQMQQSLQQLRSLREIDRAITGSIDLHLILGILLDQVRTRLGADAADILLLDPYTNWLEYSRGYGFATEARLHDFRLRLGEGLAGKAALERKFVRDQNLEHTDSAFVHRQPFDDGLTAYVGVPLISKGNVYGVMELFHRSPLPENPAWMSFLEALAGQAAIAIDNVMLFQKLQRSNTDLTLAYDANIEAWSHALDLRDRETEGHSLRVTEATVLLARRMGLSGEKLLHVRRGALLHDIGKMGVPDSILLKPGKLTDEEWVIMKKHPVFAHDLLSPIAFLRPSLDIPYCHHEKWDGSGYPRGLRGEEIPMCARIFAIIDVWDALRSDRPYREAWPEEKVREYIRASSGSHFDPEVVTAFLDMENLLEEQVRATFDSSPVK